MHFFVAKFLKLINHSVFKVFAVLFFSRNYLLFSSDLECSYALIEEDSLSKNSLPADAKIIWFADAETVEEACLLRNQFLGWEPYRPYLYCEADLMALVPVDKHQVLKAQLLINLGYPEVTPVLMKIFEWIQDMNWPVARVFAPFLSSIGHHCHHEIKFILSSNDFMWKYWLLTSVIAKMNKEKLLPLIPYLKELQNKLTAEDREHEIDLAITEILQMKD